MPALKLRFVDVSKPMRTIGRDRVLQTGPQTDGGPSWAVIHNPEGHNILLLQRRE